jgi:hypothetical protein
MRKIPDMRKTFAALDDVLIERIFQPISNQISNQLRLSKATAACFCIDTASLAWIVSRTRGLSGAVTAWDAGAAFLDLVLLLLGLAALICLRSLFRRAATGKQANPLRQAMQPHRAIVLLMLATRLTQLQTFSLTDAADLAMLLSASAALYLGACVERPPLCRQQEALIPAPVRG